MCGKVNFEEDACSVFHHFSLDHIKHAREKDEKQGNSTLLKILP
jgi:hypothetical protein